MSNSDRSVLKVRLAGAYVIRSIDGKSSRVEPRHDPNYVRAVPSAADRKLVAALLARKR